MMVRLHPLLALAVCVAGQNTDLLKLRENLKSCLTNEAKELNKCLLEMANSLKPFMKEGIPELNIPATEPMYLPKIAFNLDAKAFGQIDVTFINNTITGLSSHRIESIQADKAAKTISLNIHIPKTEAVGMYKMAVNSKFFDFDDSLPFEPYNSNFFDLTVDAVATFKGRGDGKFEIKEDPTVEIKVGRMNIDMENLFGGQADLFAKSILNTVNKDSQKFIKDFGPGISQQVGTFIKGFYNSAIANLDLNVFE